MEAEWTLSDYDVVDINGDVNQDAFEEADDEQGKLISASVELSCGEHRQLSSISFFACVNSSFACFSEGCSSLTFS